MQGVILTACRGKRLQEYEQDIPKCLLTIGEQTLLELQLRCLQRAGVDCVCVVVGHRASDVRCIGGSKCEYILNSDYDDTNTLYSLSLVRKWVTGPFMLVNSDVLADPEIFRRVAGAKGCVLVFDSSSGSEPEHMKVSFADGRLRAIAKNLTADEADGENVGILKFDARGAGYLLAAAEEVCETEGKQCWAPSAVDRIASDVDGWMSWSAGAIRNSRKCQNNDTPNMMINPVA